ncbi:nitrilase-related carbon-nitrogen hydrolase [Streptomyces sp. NBC_00063]
MTSLRVALAQVNAGPDRESNLTTAERLLRRAADRGAELAVLPEFFGAYGPPDRMRAAAEPLNGPTATWARGIATALGIDLIAGSFVETADDGRHYNTSVHVGRDGDIRAVYRKIHLYDATLPGAETRESDLFDHGSQAVVTTVADGVGVGLSVCYDLRFPELYRSLADAPDVRLLVNVAAFPERTTRDHWPTLVRARAIENQSFMLACSQVGEHPWGRTSGGRSMICDPWGVVVAQAGDAVELVVSELDFDRQRWTREHLPALSSRRTFSPPAALRS